ncbi:ankyrin repeat-containing domain protein [Xylariaceae sp. FL1272]|nr:ankyrin repeat-containing domain protein [Xylariaceae sp. FL1272]
MPVDSIQISTETDQKFRSWIQRLVHFPSGEAALCPLFKDLLAEDSDDGQYIWHKIMSDAHDKLAKFCISRLTSDTGIISLKETLSKYQSALRNQRQELKVEILVLPKDEDLILYAVQALPHHLALCRSSNPAFYSQGLSFFSDKSTELASSLWAKAYWAMINPLSRTTAPPESPLPICVGLGLLGPDILTGMHGNLQTQCFNSAFLGKLGFYTLDLHMPRSLPLSTYVGFMLSAIQANDQTTALSIAEFIFSHQEWNSARQDWGKAALCRATWLKMVDLVQTLIERGLSFDMDSSTEPALKVYTSLLNLSTSLGHAAIVEILLSNGASPFPRSENSTHYVGIQSAASRGHAEIVQMYISHDASFVTNQDPSTALYAASEWGAWNCVEPLIEGGAKVNEKQGKPVDDHRYWRPLAIACKHGHIRTVEALLKGGADANALGPYGVDTALWFPAYDHPNVACVKLLLGRKADPNHSYFSPPLLIEMTSSGHHFDRLLPICEALRNAGMPSDLDAIDHSGSTALIDACRRGKLEFAKWLLASGARHDIQDCVSKSALHHAISNGYADIVAALLEKGASVDIDFSGFDSLPSTNILQLLIRAGANVNSTHPRRDALINKASSAGNLEAAKILIENGADINHEDSFGWKPIFDAVGYKPSAGLIRLFAERGADMSGEVGSETLLQKALSRDIEILKVLLEFRDRIDIDERNSRGFAAVHVAITRSDTKYLQTLIWAGADLSLTAPDGRNALQIAAESSDTVEHLKILLAQPGVIVDGDSKRGTALCNATWNFNADGARLLIEAGADPNHVGRDALFSTALMTLLGAYGRGSSFYTRSDDIRQIDIISRMLILNDPRKKADVTQAVPGSRFHTALAAACMAASPTTLKFLLEEGADVHVADPLSGRLPHHFAAANGITNFRAIVLSYRADLMAADNEQKNCLHWAAQFGNRQTVNWILSRLLDEGRLVRYVNRPDSDGWTPLCWAARPCESRWAKVRSEEADYAGVILALIRRGARRDVKCTLGNGTDVEHEQLTPLELARRCEAGEEIISLLRYGIGYQEGSKSPGDGTILEGPQRVYAVQRNWVCDICLNRIIGNAFECDTCDNYSMCSKCLPHVSTFHPGGSQDGEGAHGFRAVTRLDEYKYMASEETSSGNILETDEDTVGDLMQVDALETLSEISLPEEMVGLDDIEV